jgi:hypothetical protein
VIPQDDQVVTEVELVHGHLSRCDEVILSWLRYVIWLTKLCNSGSFINGLTKLYAKLPNKIVPNSKTISYNSALLLANALQMSCTVYPKSLLFGNSMPTFLALCTRFAIFNT